MRKVLLTILTCLVMSASCYAANWEWIGANADKGFSFDEDTIVFATSPDRKIVNRDVFYVWVKIVFDPAYAKRQYHRDDVAYCVDRFGFDLANNKICEKTVVFYDVNKEVIHTVKDALKWQTPIPDSAGEDLMRVLGKYARAHEAEIEQRTRGK